MSKKGLAILGALAAASLGLWALTRKVEAAPPVPPTVPTTADFLAASSTSELAQLLALAYDAYQAGEITAEQLATLYAAYQSRFTQLTGELPPEKLPEVPTVAQFVAATTHEELDRLHDLAIAAYQAGAITEKEYNALYLAYKIRWEQIVVVPPPTVLKPAFGPFANPTPAYPNRKTVWISPTKWTSPDPSYLKAWEPIDGIIQSSSLTFSAWIQGYDPRAYSVLDAYLVLTSPSGMASQNIDTRFQHIPGYVLFAKDTSKMEGIRHFPIPKQWGKYYLVSLTEALLQELSIRIVPFSDLYTQPLKGSLMYYHSPISTPYIGEQPYLEVNYLA